MPGVFVTATGTDVGKTYVTAGLIRAGRRAGLAMEALKPVLSGFSMADAAASDAGVLLHALGRPVTPAAVAAISLWRYAAPLSPDMAAAAEGQSIDFDAVLAACRAAVRPDRLTLIEGVGGVMVPLDSRHTILDLVAALGLPVVSSLRHRPRRDQPSPDRARRAGKPRARRGRDRAERDRRQHRPVRRPAGDARLVLRRHPARHDPPRRRRGGFRPLARRTY